MHHRLDSSTYYMHSRNQSSLSTKYLQYYSNYFFFKYKMMHNLNQDIFYQKKDSFFAQDH